MLVNITTALHDPNILNMKHAHARLITITMHDLDTLNGKNGHT